jgi:hypothetical protein
LREPHEVWDYNDVVAAAEKLYKSGNSEFESADRVNMFERHARERKHRSLCLIFRAEMIRNSILLGQ